MFLVPGQEIKTVFQNASIGIRENKEAKTNKVVSSAIGELLSLDNSNYWINYKQHRYIPLLDDIVLGVIKGKGKDSYKVDIGSPSYAIINQMDFPSATKRNRTVLKTGDVILGQITDDSLHSEIVMSCRTEAVQGMGLLKNGLLIKVGILQGRKYLLYPPSLNITASTIFSMNGYAWVTPATKSNVKEILKLV